MKYTMLQPKIRVALGLLALIFFLIIPVQAHEIKSSGSLAVLLHMNPDDSPIVGEQATLIFAFTDVKGVFNVKNCECVASVKQKDNQLFSKALEGAPEGYGSNASQIFYTFPKKGIYQVVISGKHRTGPNFEPFSISYNVRIERESSNQAPVDPLVKKADRTLLILSIVGIIGIIIIILSIRNLRKNK